MQNRHCSYCGAPLRVKARADAQYCSDRCRHQGCDLRKELAHLPSEIQEFFERLQECRPAEAAGYLVGFNDRDQSWFYPPTDRPSRRWKGTDIHSRGWRGTASRRGYFSLRPFEPPIVPRAARYGILFIDAKGDLVLTPPELLDGVDLVPLLPIQVEDGERWQR